MAFLADVRENTQCHFKRVIQDAVKGEADKASMKELSS